MQTQITKKIDFTGKYLFVGLDVHKKIWSVTIIVDGMEHRTFTQPPDPEALQKYLQRSFPGGNYHSAYEAGYCGYGIHRRLNGLEKNTLHGIHVLDLDLEELRSLNRTRFYLMRDL